MATRKQAGPVLADPPVAPDHQEPREGETSLARHTQAGKHAPAVAISAADDPGRLAEGNVRCRYPELPERKVARSPIQIDRPRGGGADQANEHSGFHPQDLAQD